MINCNKLILVIYNRKQNVIILLEKEENSWGKKNFNN